MYVASAFPLPLPNPEKSDSERFKFDLHCKIGVLKRGRENPTRIPISVPHPDTFDISPPFVT